MKKSLLAIILLLVFFPVMANAKENVFIKNITCENMYDGEKVDDYKATINGTSIVTDDAKFTLLGDYVKCEVEVTNNSKEKIKLDVNSIIKNNNDNLSYDVTYAGDNLIKAGESKKYAVTVTYKTGYSNPTIIDNIINLTFTSGNIINPNTGNKIFIISVMIALFSFIVFALLRKQRKYYICLLPFVTFISLSIVNALVEYNFVLYNKIIVEVPSFSLKIDPNGGEYEHSTGIQEFNVKKSNTLNLSTPTRIGYTFDGWDIQGEYSSVNNNVFLMGKENTILSANWKINSYHLTIDLNGGIYNGSTSILMEYNSATTLEEPTKEGYTFTGWTVSNGILNNNDFTILDSDATITANWVVNSYAYLVTHSQMNVTGSGYTIVDSDSELGEKEFGTTYTPSTKDYVGFTSPSRKSLTIQVDTNPPTKNILNYNYSRNKYTITINNNNGTSTTTRNEYYDSRVSIPTPTKNYYNFTGWDITDGTITDGYLTVPANNTTLTAKYTPIEYNITYNLDGGVLDNSVGTYTIESSTITLGIPTKEGFVFVGWTGSNGNSPQKNVSIPSGSAGNKTYTAVWRDDGPIGYDCNGVEVTSTNPTTLKGLAKIMASQSYLDNVKSEYVSSCSGIKFSEFSSDTNGKGVYEIASTKDDAYPIYYYRGAVNNNNVIFANYCWKAVRTTDTGGVKMLYNGVPDANGYCANTGDDSEIGKTNYNNVSGSDAYVGYMFGTKDHSSTGNAYEYEVKRLSGYTSILFGQSVEYNPSSRLYTLVNTTSTTNLNTISRDYRYTCLSSSNSCTTVYMSLYNVSSMVNYQELYGISISGVTPEDGQLYPYLYRNVFSNDRDSTIKQVIETWYQENMTEYTSKIEDTIYCNDRSFLDSSGNIYDPNIFVIQETSFAAYDRIVNNNSPSLVCARNEDRFTVSSSKGNGKLKYPIALLTYDEKIYAGGKGSSNNNSYFLNNGQEYWTMTPGQIWLSAFHRHVITMSVVGVSYYPFTVMSSNYGVRPVISLSPNAIIQVGGDGTANNPYVVEYSS